MEDLSNTKRKVIGIMTGSFHTNYSKTITSAISENLSDMDVEVRLFQGLDASRFLKVKHYIDEGFDLHYYSMYEYSRFMKLDLLILSYGTISAISDPLSLPEFLSYLPEVPVILLEDDTEISRGIHVVVDNYQGMKDCVKHLIEEHGCRKILYISGPVGVVDSMARYHAYLDAVKEAGLEAEEGMVAWGDFTDHVDDLVKDLLERYPDADAIVAANDEMAESVYRVLKKAGKTPGKDIAVTGFDDNSYAAYMDPPLTTVRQDASLVAEAVLQKVRNFLDGRSVVSEKVPARLVVRESCGCMEKKEAVSEKSRHSGLSQAENDHVRIKALEYDHMLSALLFRNILSEYVKLDSFFENLGKQFIRLGISFSAIYLLKEPIRVRSQKKMFLPKEVFLYMRQVGEEIITFRPDRIIRAGAEELESPGEIQGNIQTAVFPLFYGDLHYGMFWVGIDTHQLLFYYALSLEIGSGLRYLYMALDQQASHAALEEKSIVLDYSANHDEMTGCYNRAGIMGNLLTFIHGYGEGERFVAVMADLDHLKQINDTFGHAEGDQAIKKAAEVLKDAMPVSHLLGRTGGDEFTAVFHLEKDGAEERFMEQVWKSCEAYNQISGKPYYFHVSIGCTVFEYGDRERIPELLKVADQRLYEAKKKRRENVIRG